MGDKQPNIAPYSIICSFKGEQYESSTQEKKKYCTQQFFMKKSRKICFVFFCEREREKIIKKGNFI